MVESEANLSINTLRRKLFSGEDEESVLPMDGEDDEGADDAGMPFLPFCNNEGARTITPQQAVGATVRYQHLYAYS